MGRTRRPARIRKAEALGVDPRLAKRFDKPTIDRMEAECKRLYGLPLIEVARADAHFYACRRTLQEAPWRRRIHPMYWPSRLYLWHRGRYWSRRMRRITEGLASTA